MSITKSLLLGSAAVLATVVGAQAADLPSKKAAPATYVKICDAYGAGFYTIPGTDTCVKVGGYVRAEYQYTPGQATNNYNGVAANNGKSDFSGVVSQNSGAQSTTGFEARGRIDVDARTPTAMGAARTFIRLRLTNSSGIRNEFPAAGQAYVMKDNSATVTSNVAASGVSGNSVLTGSGPTIESAMVQWAGFTFGVGPENYAMMPSFEYHSNPWTGFPNGMKQIAYTATFGGGLSATIALEDMQDQNLAQVAFQQPSTAAEIVANLRLDQAWGFAAIHAMVGNDSISTGSTSATASSATGLVGFTAPTVVTGQSTKGNYAIGATVSYKLPMIAAGDQVWFNANYAHGLLGAIVSAGALNNVYSTSADHRLIGGVVRIDTNLVPTDAFGGIGVTNAWNVGAAFTHYWSAQWRSNFTAGYVEINPPTSTVVTWGKGKLWEVAGGIIYSPAKDLDIGLEVQYANMKNTIQNASTSNAWALAGSPGLSANNWSTKLRVERQF